LNPYDSVRYHGNCDLQDISIQKSMSRRARCLIHQVVVCFAYDGFKYCGWQIKYHYGDESTQPNQKAIEGNRLGGQRGGPVGGKISKRGPTIQH
jgi:hypothetical protein